MATSTYVYDNYETYTRHYKQDLFDEDMHCEVIELYVKPTVPDNRLWVVTEYVKTKTLPRPMLNHAIVHFMHGTIDPHDDIDLYKKSDRPVPITGNDMTLDLKQHFLQFKKPRLRFWRKPLLSLHVDKLCGDFTTNKCIVQYVLFDKVRDRLNFVLEDKHSD